MTILKIMLISVLGAIIESIGIRFGYTETGNIIITFGLIIPFLLLLTNTSYIKCILSAFLIYTPLLSGINLDFAQLDKFIIFDVFIGMLWITYHWYLKNTISQYNYKAFIYEIPFRTMAIYLFYISGNQDYIWPLNQFLNHYIIIASSFILLNIGLIRVIFGLPLLSGQSQINKLISRALLIGIGFWIIDSLYLYIFKESAIQYSQFHSFLYFMDKFILNVPPHAIFDRMIFLMICMLVTMLSIRYFRDYEANQQSTDKLKNYVIKLNECYLNFSTNSKKNIKTILSVYNEMVNAYFVEYSIMRDNKIKVTATTVLNKKPYVDSIYKYNFLMSNRNHDNISIVNVTDNETSDIKMYIGTTIQISDKVTGILCIAFDKHVDINDEDYKLLGIIASIISMEEKRNNAISQSRENELLFNAMADNMTDMLWAKDIEGKYLFANKTIRNELLICDDEDPIGKTDIYFAQKQKHIGEILGVNDYHTFGEKCVASDKIVLETESTGRFEEFGNISGIFTILDVSKSPLYNKKGYIIGTVGMARNITHMRELEQQYYNIVNNSKDIIARIDRDFTYTYVNSAISEIFPGIKQEEFIGRSHGTLDILPLEHIEQMNRSLISVFNEGIEQRHYIEIKSPDGNDKYIDWIAVPEKSKNDEINHALIYARDITPTVKAQKEAKEYQTKLSILLDLAPVLIIFHSNRKIFYVNKKVEECIGKEDKEIIGMDIIDIIDKRSREECLMYMKIRDANSTDSCDIIINTIDGPRWFRSYNRIVNENDKSYTSTILIDIQEEKQHKDRLEMVFSSIEEGYWDWDIENKTIFLSKPWYKVMGYGSKIGSYSETVDVFLDIIYKDDLPAFKKALYRYIDMSITINTIFEYTYRIHKQERIVWIKTIGSVVEKDLRGHPTRMVGVNIDYTSHKESEEILEKYRERLEKDVKQKTAELQMFSHAVSHDLRTPIRHILNYIDILADEFEITNDNIKEYMDIIKKSGINVYDMIEGYLRLFRATKEKLTKETVDLTQLCKDVFEITTADCKHVRLDVQENMLEYCDKTLMLSVFQNLITNACKFTTDVSSPYIEIGKKDHVYYVKDNGIGFPSEKAEELFVPGGRLHGKTEHSGHGIGLAVVKVIIENHNGSIWAESQINKGSTFYFTLNDKIGQE